MLSAVFAGLLVLAGALWAANQVRAIDLPTPTWSLAVQSPSGPPPAPGTTLELFDTSQEPPLKLGTAEMRRDVGDRTWEVGNLAIAPGQSALAATRLTAPGGLAATVTGRKGIPIVEPLYVSVGVASLVVIVGVVLIYLYVGRRHGSVDFLIAVDGEMKKVNWSTRQVITDSTIVVIGATFLIAAYLFASDQLVSTILRLIGVRDY